LHGPASAPPFPELELQPASSSPMAEADAIASTTADAIANTKKRFIARTSV
jgi:hypothetical protein